MAIARSSITIIRRWCWCWDILRPLDCIVLPLLAFHIILLFIALVTFVAVCREAVSSRRPWSFFVKLEPRGTRPMPWIPPERAVPKGPHGGEIATSQNIRCDLCSWETQKAYWGPRNARAEAGVYWPKADQGEGEPESWCPECASRESKRASDSYYSTGLNVEAVMSRYWRAPTGRELERGVVGQVAEEHPGRVPPKAPPPGISSLATEERLAALEEEVARLRRRVAELEGRSSGAATSSAPPSGTPRLLD